MDQIDFWPVVLPCGRLAHVLPYHVCTKGLEDRVLLKDEEDFRVANNYVPISAARANVVVLAHIGLSTHDHNIVLAENYADAEMFADSLKMSKSRYLQTKYGTSAGPFLKGVECRPIPIKDRRYLRNAICYTFRNANDMGHTVDDYKWSSFRSVFNNRPLPENLICAEDLSVRQFRKLFRTRDKFEGSPWLIDNDGVLEPKTYCDWRYVERLFGNDQNFFFKVLGMTDTAQVEHDLIVLPSMSMSCAELLREIENRCQSRYGKALTTLTTSQKIPIIRAIYFGFHSSPAQLARCFGIHKNEMEHIISLF